MYRVIIHDRDQNLIETIEFYDANDAYVTAESWVGPRKYPSAFRVSIHNTRNGRYQTHTLDAIWNDHARFNRLALN